ncbi:MAG: hypothetical protein AAGF23_03915, partial [Acidobacteriota bacterium]
MTRSPEGAAAAHLYRLGVDVARATSASLDRRRLGEPGPIEARLAEGLDRVFGGVGRRPDALTVTDSRRSDLYVASHEPVGSTQLRELYARLEGGAPRTFALEIERDDAVIRRLLRVDGAALRQAVDGAAAAATLRPDGVLAALASEARRTSGETFEPADRARELGDAWRRRQRLGGRPVVLAAHGAGDG